MITIYTINLILKIFIVFIILFCILKLIPSNTILNKEIVLIILINLIIFYILQKIYN
jgi:hypothetical protein